MLVLAATESGRGITLVYSLLKTFGVISMDQPATVKGLCEKLKTPFVDLLLPCTFCSRFLTNLEKALFDYAPLQLQWKHGNAFGCCQSCIRTCGYLEKKLFTDRLLTEHECEELGCRMVRCGGCMKLLTSPEKDRSRREGCLWLARGQCRGYCDLCRLFTEQCGVQQRL